MSKIMVDVSNLRARAVAALSEYETGARIAAEAEETLDRKRRANMLRDEVWRVFDVALDDSDIEWPEVAEGAGRYDDDRYPFAWAEDIRFRVGSDGIEGYLHIGVRRPCGHIVESQERGTVPLLALGRLLASVQDPAVRCSQCEHEAAEAWPEEANPTMAASAYTSPLSERLDAVVREIVRDELDQREGAAAQ